MIQHGTRGDMAAGPDDGVSDNSTCLDGRTGANDGIFQISGCRDIRSGVDGGSEGKLLVGLEVRFSVAQIEPYALIESDGTEQAVFRQFEKSGDHRDFLVGREKLEEEWIDAVDAGENVGAGGEIEGTADIDDALACGIESNVLCITAGAQGEGDG